MKKLLLGLSKKHIDEKYSLHKEVVPPYLKLKEKLQLKGHDLQIVSGHRSFERQLTIWNNKAQGKRELLDASGNLLDYKTLSEEELVHSILRWSALPGASRHHWGTDFDIIDKSTIPDNYIVKLTPEETRPGGPFFEIHNEIDHLIEDEASFDFFRPYNYDQKGVAPEKWHLSYAPLSKNFLKNYTFEFFQNFLNTLDENNFLLLPFVKRNALELYKRYIINISEKS